MNIYYRSKLLLFLIDTWYMNIIYIKNYLKYTIYLLIKDRLKGIKQRL